ncbi:SIMPL domain-containing protein [Phycicoccus sonneratiae]|uniref:SIMPL domain-containing protein n=1 Tax=Phycicoccus sonneratiae TaxID=2807628 RepID=A0ABS2CLZ9_9MICO|nr:SIMPL domain-containing protein [Phycicoccus sonneraticus]MBM6400868.1 SIMPL domain-containing protein [Phycicoccus sonneraticus]
MSDHVEVIGTGTASASPDVVVVDVRVSVEAADVAAALSGLAARLDATLTAAADHGVHEHDRRTTGMGVSPRWDREGQGITGYTAHQALRLRVRDRERVGDVISALAGAAGDALGVDNVSLEVADPSPLLVRARAAAFADASTRARQYADLAGRHLGPVLELTEVPAGGGPVPMPKARFAAMDAGGVPVEGGESSITATVVVRFALGPA